MKGKDTAVSNYIPNKSSEIERLQKADGPIDNYIFVNNN